MTAHPVFLCPGQGAQRVGIGKAWFDASPDAARTFGAADDILHDRIGAKLSDICFNGPTDRLNRTDIAQPALYVTAIAAYQAEFAGLDAASFIATAGLSLGEYTALYLARAISFHDGLELVALRGRAMQDAADDTNSGMVALIGADEHTAQRIRDDALNNAPDSAVLVIANLNAPGQIVLSGSSDACDAALKAAENAGTRATPLPVAGAFHSPLMQPAADRLRDALAATEINPPACRVLSNVTAEPHTDPAAPSSRDADAIRENLARQLTAPVRWEQTCRWLIDHADRNAPDAEFHELAPGKTLAGLMKRTDRARKVFTHDAPKQATT